MHRSGGHRLQALLLLLALMGAGLGLPLFDAIVFHGRPLARTESTAAPEGAQGPHTQLCILDHAGLLEGGISSSGHPPLAAQPDPAPVLAQSAASAPTRDAALLPPSRAPPVV